MTNANGKEYDYLTYERSKYGGISVHGWDEYPQNSVLSGQARKCFLDSFESVDEVRSAYPDAEASHELMQPQVSLNHLPDDGDY
jgi:hypothetical protein